MKPIATEGDNIRLTDNEKAELWGMRHSFPEGAAEEGVERASCLCLASRLIAGLHWRAERADSPYPCRAAAKVLPQPILQLWRRANRAQMLADSTVGYAPSAAFVSCALAGT